MRLIARFVDLFTFRGNRARETNDYKSNFLSLVLTNKKYIYISLAKLKFQLPVNKKRSHQRDHITTIISQITLNPFKLVNQLVFDCQIPLHLILISILQY